MSKGIEVQILGQVFTVVSDDGETHVRTVAAEVERRMSILAGQGQPAFTAAVMVALNIASEYQKLQDKDQSVQENIGRLTARLASCLPSTESGGEENNHSERAGHSALPAGSGQRHS
jgi:cell division protein ZapA (FtsZ GTPase activity inhibitor)